MGKGSNASKIARSRAEAAKRASEEKSGGGGKSGMDVRKGVGALTIICQICKTGFMSNQSRGQLEGHRESKHAKNTFSDCFPTFTDPA